MAELQIQQRVNRIITLLEDKKGEDIEVFDLRGKDYIVDKVIIVSAMIGKHSFALLDYLKSELKPQGEIFYATEEEAGFPCLQNNVNRISRSGYV